LKNWKIEKSSTRLLIIIQRIDYIFVHEILALSKAICLDLLVIVWW
jgi:hypothetical protein